MERSSPSTPEETMARYARIIVLCSIYITLSGSLINFNKYIMQEDHFPHALQLTTLHMISSLVCGFLVYLVAPSMCPGIDRSKGKRLEIFKWFIPIGVCFAVMLYGSNKAYMYCSVAFLQFMKEANVVLVFIFSWIAGMQIMSRQRAFVILWVVCGSSLCVTGEMNFVLTGFILQATSQIAECVRAVIAEYVLTAPELKLDPLSYTMFVAPVSLVVLLVWQAFTWTPEVVVNFHKMWPVLIPNAMLAVALNISIAAVIKDCSALGLIITGIVKDIVLVVTSAAIYRDQPISLSQWLSFIITLSGVAVWSLMKANPEHHIIQTMERLLGAQHISPVAAKDVATVAAPVLQSKDANAVDECTPLMTPDKRV